MGTLAEGTRIRIERKGNLSPGGPWNTTGVILRVTDTIVSVELEITPGKATIFNRQTGFSAFAEYRLTDRIRTELNRLFPIADPFPDTSVELAADVVNNPDGTRTFGFRVIDSDVVSWVLSLGRKVFKVPRKRNP